MEVLRNKIGIVRENQKQYKYQIVVLDACIKDCGLWHSVQNDK